MTVPAIIPHYKAEKKVASCIASLRRHAPECEPHVLDHSNESGRYTKFINVGLKGWAFRTDSPPYILLLTPDCYVREGTVAALITYMEKDPKCGISMPVQLTHDDSKVSCGGCTLAFPYGHHIIEPLTNKELYGQEAYDTFWANFACVLLRTEMIREIGLLDENMRFICSDADYSFTARSRGWNIRVVPKARVTHEPNAAAHTKDAFIEKCKDEDSLYFLRKWICGALYQELSAEGPTLNAQIITNRIAELQVRLEHGYT
jgi:hypothetical protein